MFPGYSYQPRKSADKKRRMTAKKAVKAEALAHALVIKEDSVNKEFKPLREMTPPALTYGRFGNHEMINFVLGNPNVTADNLDTMLGQNNTRFGRMPINDRRYPMPSIITASPAPVINSDIQAYEKLPDWGLYQSAHHIDEGQLDAAFLDHWIDPNDPRKGLRPIGPYAYYAEQEMERLAELHNLPPYNPGNHNGQ